MWDDILAVNAFSALFITYSWEKSKCLINILFFPYSPSPAPIPWPLTLLRPAWISYIYCLTFFNSAATSLLIGSFSYEKSPNKKYANGIVNAASRGITVNHGMPLMILLLSALILLIMGRMWRLLYVWKMKVVPAEPGSCSLGEQLKPTATPITIWTRPYILSVQI